MWLKCLGRLFGAPVGPSSVFHFLTRWGHIFSNFMQATTHEPAQLGSRREALMDWTHQYFSRSQSLPLSLKTNKIGSSSKIFFSFFFLPRTFYEWLARPLGSMRPQSLYEWTQTTYKGVVTPVKWVIPLLMFSTGREPTFMKHIQILRILHPQHRENKFRKSERCAETPQSISWDLPSYCLPALPIGGCLCQSHHT